MSLAMSQAGKLFDKKNAGSSGTSGNASQDKAQGGCQGFEVTVGCVLNVVCSDASGRCDCNEIVCTEPEQRQQRRIVGARLGRHYEDWKAVVVKDRRGLFRMYLNVACECLFRK